MALHIDYTQDALYRLGYQKGHLKGLQEAHEEVATNMLKEGLAVELIGEITGLAAERIAQLGQQPEADA
jgi:predicted transposase YdaD